jgi:hypothetical protein
VGNNRAQAPLDPAPSEPGRVKSQGLLTKGLGSSGSHHPKNRLAKAPGPPGRIPPHLEADVSQSDRDALTGLPFS